MKFTQTSLLSIVVLLTASLLNQGDANSIYNLVCKEVVSITSGGVSTTSECVEKCDGVFIMAIDSEEQMIDQYCGEICYKAVVHGLNFCHP